MARVPKPPSERKYTLQHMWERHHQMARLLLLGYTNKEVAEVLGCTPQNVSDVRNSPVFQEKMAVLRDAADDEAVDVIGQMKKDAGKSLRILEQMRDGELTQDAKLRAQVAQDLLDRAGYGKIQKVEGRHAVAYLDAEALERIKNLAHGRREAVEAEVVEETDS